MRMFAAGIVPPLHLTAYTHIEDSNSSIHCDRSPILQNIITYKLNMFYLLSDYTCEFLFVKKYRGELFIEPLAPLDKY
jgi:hypothetical protein